MKQTLSGKTILITGGVGSVGKVLIERCLSAEPDVIRVLDIDESGLFRLQSALTDERLRYFVGDVRDYDRLEMAMNGVDIVFNAAALKHVGFCEYNPFEAVKTNIIGGQNVIKNAIRHDVEKVINVSTDKASMPVTVMGATKLVTERLFSAGNVYASVDGTNFVSVRFGNVFDSNGSVAEIFRRQIASGGPVTVTDPDMTRFIMTGNRAVDLIIKAVSELERGDVGVLKMPSVRIGDLAETMINELATNPDDIDIKIIGPHPAERMHEKLISEEEATHAIDIGEMFKIKPMIEAAGSVVDEFDATTILDGEYTSANQSPLSQKEIAALLTVD
jgi:FlaA1/EpsC-like NDP-sugar epimerase